MNFNSIYQAALNKACKTAETGDNRALNLLEDKIKIVSPLTKQFTIYETFKNKAQGMSEDDAQAFILFVERYCSKLDYEKLRKENVKLVKDFSINPKDLVIESLDDSIDQLIRMCSGGTVRLEEGTKYRKTLLEYYTAEPKVILENTERDEIIESLMNFHNITPYEIVGLITEAVAEEYNQLNEKDQNTVNIVRQENRGILKTKLEVIEHYAGKIKNEGERKMIGECAACLKEEIDSKPVADTLEKIYNLHETVGAIREGEYGGAAEMKLPDSKILKKVKIEVMDNQEMPDTMEITFRFPVYALGAGYQDYKRALQDVDKRVGRMHRTLLNRTIFAKENPRTFTVGDEQGLTYADFYKGGGIWETTVRTEGVKPGTPSDCRVYWYLYTTEEYSFDELKEPTMQLIKDVEGLIAGAIPETDPANQAEFLASIAGEKKTKKRGTVTKADDGPKVGSDDAEYYKAEPSTSVAEPTAKDIKGVDLAGIEDDM